MAVLPRTVYHTTPRVDSVIAQGLKSRAELEDEGDLSRALGGGPDDTVSFTSDEGTAHQILKQLHQVHHALNNMSVPEIWDTAGDEQTRARARGIYRDMTGAHPDDESRHEANKGEAIKAVFRARDENYLEPDSVFFGGVQHIGALNPEQFGVIEFRSSGDVPATEVPGMSEYRTEGSPPVEAVRVDREVRESPVPPNTTSVWRSGGTGPTMGRRHIY